MAGWLSRSDAESCKCCKCCKFRPDHNLSAKIWALYLKPKTTLWFCFFLCSKSFAGLTEYFDRCTEILNCVRQRHIASWSMLCCCVMKYSQWIVLLLSLSKVVCFDPPCSRTYVLHVWDKNWTIGNIQPGHQGLQLKVGIVVQLFYDQNQTLQPTATILSKDLQENNLTSWTLCLIW